MQEIIGGLQNENIRKDDRSKRLEKRIKEVGETDNAIEVIEEDGSFVILPIRNIIYCKIQKEEKDAREL